MVSILGNLGYEFPKPKVLDKKLKDLLDDHVDESFYLSNSKLNIISQWKAHQDPLKDIDKLYKQVPAGEKVLIDVKGLYDIDELKKSGLKWWRL